MAKYKGRDVQIVRDASKGDPYWTGNEDMVVIYSQDQGEQVVPASEVSDEKVGTKQTHEGKDGKHPILSNKNAAVEAANKKN